MLENTAFGLFYICLKITLKFISDTKYTQTFPEGESPEKNYITKENT